MGTYQHQQWCSHCHEHTLHVMHSKFWRMTAVQHVFWCILTCGLWTPAAIMAIATGKTNRYHCQRCGSIR